MTNDSRPRRSAVVAERMSLLMLALGLLLFAVELVQYVWAFSIIRDPGTAAAVLIVLSFLLHRYARRRARRAW